MHIRSPGVLVPGLFLLGASVGAWRLVDTSHVTWSADEQAQLRELALDQLPPLAPDPSNRHADDPKAARLGEQLFFDTRLSANGKVACSSCHVAHEQFQDGRPLALGVGHTTRRTMPVMAAAHATWQFWDGRKDSQWSQALGPLESAVEHGGTRLGHVRVVAQHYQVAYEAVFGPLPDLVGLPPNAGPVADPTLSAAWDAIAPTRQDAINHAFANLGKAIAAYERQVGFGESRFDRHMVARETGNRISANARLSADELAGAKLFVGKANCINCHNGPLFTDQHFHNTGVPAVAGLPADDGRWSGARLVQQDPFNCLGRYSDAQPEECEELRYMASDDSSMRRAFKTPTLRNVVERAPYMHAGQFATLEQVVEHYDRAAPAPAGHSELRPLGLSARERAQLVAFLRSLSGPVVMPGVP